MRSTVNTHIQDLWDAGGPFIGDDGAPHGRVTVEIGWELRKSASSVIGDYDHGPIRWFQRADNSQTETEVPNIKTIDINRTIDTDAATCAIVMFNQKMLANDDDGPHGIDPDSTGQPGFYTFTRGDSDESNTLWGQTQNAWNDVLQPNALIRTYQGYGGRDKTIAQAIEDGNILLTGTWLVDDVQIEAKTGDLTINCRDMVKLLIEQSLYPPLVPTTGSVHYPLSYNRFKFVDHEVIPYGTTVYHAGFIGDNVALTIHATSSDLEGATIDGHKPLDAIDGEDSATYWLSGGHVTGTSTDDMEYIDFNADNNLYNGVNIQPWGGNYIVYVSIMVGSDWQTNAAGGTIPYTGSISGMAIPYVAKVIMPWEQAVTAYLNGSYATSHVRLTFSRLTKSSVGPKFYRAGVRNFEIGNYSKTVSAPGGRTIRGIATGYSNVDRGYWLVGSDGGVFTFGNLKFFGSRANQTLTDGTMVGIASTGTGDGYRLVSNTGAVFCFGAAAYKGSLPGDAIVSTTITGIVNGDNGGAGGYYLFSTSGQVYAFGDADYFGNYSGSGIKTGMASIDGGYWITNHLGAVQSFGSAAGHGGSPTLASGDIIVDIEATSTGDGYWLVSAFGAVYAFGDADYFGGANDLNLNGNFVVGISAIPGDAGYLLGASDGGVFAYGAAQFNGSLPEQFQESDDGNYTDYVDIVKDIVLWCGWWFRDPGLGDASPAVPFGNYESTGIYSPDIITEDYFDQKPAIDVINALKEIVGYIILADESGGFHFESPNIWSIGNFLETGVPTSIIPVLDERLQLTDYTLSISDADANSTITIANQDPTIEKTALKEVTIKSQWGEDLLNGIVKPGAWFNGNFIDITVMSTMAHLIDLHLFMAQRQGQVIVPANPVLQIGDQIRIFERTTSDTYVHYLRGYDSSMDLDSGSYLMTVQTHWMGDGSSWFLTY